MKKKDILTLTVCVLVLLGSLVFIYIMLFPQKAKQASPTSDNQQEERITGNLDKETLQKVSELKNYVSTNLDNIGRTDPFGPLN